MSGGAPSPGEREELLRRRLAAARRRRSTAPAPPARRVEVAPLTADQERLWYLDRLFHPSGLYNVTRLLHLAGDLHSGRLAAAVDALAVRQPALRTAFDEEAGEPRQRVTATRPGLPLVDLAGLPPAAAGAALAAAAARQARTPFDLAGGRPFRAVLCHLGPGRWALLLAAHHLVLDGWSFGVVLRELSVLYRAAAAGTAPALAPLAVDFAAHAAAERRAPAGEEAAAADLDFWRRRLAAAEPPELPADRPAPAQRTPRGGVVHLELDTVERRRVEALAAENRASPFAVLLTLWAGLLGRLSGQRRVVVGIPAAGRDRAELEPVVGFFVHTLPLPVELADAASLGELAGRTAAAVRQAFDHRRVPLAELVPALSADRASPPWTRVLFSLDGSPLGDLDLLGVRLLAVEPVEKGAVEGDLALLVEERDAGYRVRLLFSRDLFAGATAAKLAGRFRRLAAAWLAEPGLPWSRLELLDDAERREVLVERNRTASRYPRDGVLAELFAARAAAAPGAVALVDGAERLTYGELDRRANRLARRLRRLGVGPEVVVAVAVPRSAAAIVAILAVVKAGGAYLPLEPGDPAERLAFVLRDAGARVVITAGGGAAPPAAAALPATAVVVDVEREAAALAAESAAPLASGCVPESLAYVIYTSGSTGRPKGVAVCHRGVVRLVADPNYFQAGPQVRMAQVSTLAFDAATFEIWGALLGGGRLVVAPRETVLDPPALAEFLRRNRITTFFLTASLFAQVARQLPAAFAGVEDALFGGEAADPAALRAVLAADPPRRLTNGYGPTEVTTFAVFHHVGAVAPEQRAVPIGRPLCDTRAYVLDRHLGPLPDGVAGELFLAGDGLARGYLGRPALTAERFLPDPFDGPGGRLYRTGDRARWGRDGIDYLGRLDDQVKLRGFRIELGEIEAALADCPGVAAAAVAVRGEGEGRHLAAFVVPVAGERPGAAELAAALRRRLPEFMLPSAWAVVAALPVTATGKVDRRRLPETAAGEPAAGDDGAPRAPRSAAEALMVELWREALESERIGPDDELFAAGGHSLRAMRLLGRVREAFAVELSLADLYAAPTPAALTAAVLTARGNGGDDPPPVPRPRTAEVPLSRGQRRLWLLQRLDPASAAYNVPVALWLAGALDVAALDAALAALADRHQVLRTLIDEDAAGGVAGRIDGERRPPLAVVDLSRLGEAAARREARRAAGAAARRPFDLARELPLRAAVFRLGGEAHLLLVEMHHAAVDGWSLGVVADELAELYAAAAARRPPALPAPPLQVADVAAWQEERLAGGRLAGDLAWWRDRLAGLPPVLELPADRPRGGRPGAAVGRVAALLPPELAAAVAEAARRRRTTPFVVLLAAFAALLGRGSGRTDPPIAFPTAGRERPELEGLVGFFVNTLVLRPDLAGDPPFGELVERTRRDVLAALDRREVPFERLVEELAPEREASTPPLAQVLVAERSGGPRWRLPGLAVEPLPLPPAGAKLDLAFEIDRRADGVEVACTFRRDLFDRATAEATLGRFRALLAGALAEPARPLRRLPWLTAEERRQVLGGWSAGAGDYPREAGLGELFARRAAATPDAVAVVAGGEAVTYGELAGRAGRLAARLAALGVGPESRVGVALERSVELIEALLAVVRAGGAYVPLDPAYPAERLAFMAADAALSAVVTRGAAAARLPADLPRLDLDGEAAAPAAATAGPPAATGGDHLAYVMYTSGSTGRPKGVAVPHRAVVRLAVGGGFADLGRERAWLGLAPISFDASTLEVWGALLNGARLVLAPPGPLSLAELGRTIAAGGVDSLWLTAGLFHQVVDEHLAALAGVRQVLAGGDVLSPAHVRRVAAAYPGCRVIDGYGPTENTTFTCCHAVGAGDGAGPVPIGRPIAGTRVRVLDAAGEPVPPGVVGELYAGGDGLARGYLGRPGRTAAAFVPDPFAERPGERLYRTGDLVRWRRDGRLDFVGRRDGQVKLRGFRVEPGEVEAALAGHPEVGECAVGVRGEGAAERRLIAWFAPRPGAAPVPAALREWLGERLPAHLVPAAVVAVERLPLDPNGKVDRRALPAPPPPAAAAGDAPRDELERLLAELWCEVLGLDRVGVDDDFFALGGHSLAATKLTARLRRRLGLEVELRSVFEAPTVAGLAAALRRRTAPAAAAEPLSPRGGDGPAPLSFAQERLWFLDRLAPGDPLYNLGVRIELGGALDRAALRRAVGELERRHAALRTLYPDDGGRPRQQAAAPRAEPLPLADLAALPAAAAATAAAAIARRLAAAPFDLARGPVLRTLLLAVAPGRHRLLLVVHHVAADGWSVDLLCRELAALYAAFRAGRPSPLPPPGLDYASFAEWERRTLAGERLEEHLAWWRRRVAGIEPLELPSWRPRPAVQGFRGGRRPFALPAEERAALARLGREHGATLFMVLVAGLQALLAGWSGRRRIAVGTASANRGRAELENVVGFFVNTLVLTADLGDDPTVAGLLARAREAVLGAQAHQELPFARLVDAVAPERDLSHTPLVQAMLTLAPPLARPALPGLAVEVGGIDTGRTRFDLTVALEERDGGLGGGLGGVFEYAADLYAPATIEALAAGYRRLLAAMAGAPERRVSDLPLVAEEDARRVAAWSRGGERPARFRPAHARIAERAAAAPEAVAVEVAAERWSYRRLDRRANRLAHRLRRLGVGRETTVGLLMPRSPEMVAAILAVHKAGAAYLPLDPGYPPERLAWMLADAAPAVVVAPAGAPFAAGPAAELPPATRLLALSPGWPELAGEAADDPAVEVLPDDLAYLIYTSGSTGRPKGVMVPHRGLANLVDAFVDAWRLGPADRLLMVPSISFDASVGDLFPTLAAGAALVLPPDALDLGAAALARLCGEHRVTVVDIPAAFWQQWREELARPGAPPPPPSLRLVVAGGESVAVAQVEEWERSTGGRVTFLGPYGPTEATVCSTLFAAEAGWRERAVALRLPIGRPLPAVRVRLLDRRLRPVPPGVAGEVYLGGAGVTRGYRGRAAETALRFVPDPLAGSPGERLYRTGDLARWLPGGDLEFLGRADAQVKVRGFRVEPGEIEAVLAGHPDLDACAVAARPGAAGDRLVAYVVARPGRRPDAAALRAFLVERLPAYMVPASFTPLAALPVGPNGKLDRAALPEPAADDPAPAAGRPPRDEAERRLVAAWSEVLGRRVGLDDNFFALGGDSILALQIVARAAAAGLAVSARQLFQHQTVAELARVAGRTAAGGAAGGDGAGELVPTPIQRWFLEQAGEARDHFNQALLLEVEAAPARWRGAWRRLAERHPTLRLRAAAGDGGWRLWIAGGAAAPPFHHVELGALPPARRGAALAAAAAGAQASLDLARGPAARAALFTLGAGEPARLLVLAHHLGVDGVSWRVLLDGLARDGGGLPEATPFRAWAERLAALAAAPETAAELPYWQSVAGSPVAPLPVDFPAAPEENVVATAAAVERRLGAEATEALLRGAADAGRTRVDEVLLAALVDAFAAWSGRPGLRVTVEGHGRGDLFPDLDLSRTVGWFTVAYPLRLTRPAGGPGELLAHVRETLARVPRGGVGWGLLRHGGTADGAALRRLPEPEVGFNYLGQLDVAAGAPGGLRLAAEGAGPARGRRGRRPHLVEVVGQVRGGRLRLRFEHSLRFHAAATVERLADLYVAALERLIEHRAGAAAAPADFPHAGLSRARLERLVGKLAAIQGPPP